MNRHKLIFLLTLVLAIGFLATSLVSYQVSKHSIHDAIVDNELPLTADNIYSEIQKDLVRTVFIASMMATDTFLRDWIIDGEVGTERISRYLQEVQEKYGAFSSFLVSEKSRHYYYGEGILKSVKQEEPRDAWYFRVRQIDQPYELNVDKDLAHADALTIFVNYRVYDFSHQYIGATGVGVTVDSVQKLIDNYQQRFHRNVYFIDPKGIIILSGNQSYLPGTDIRQIKGLGKLFPEIFKRESGTYEYEHAGATHLINARYIPELKWYLFVEKSESEATSDIRYTLYLNLLLCLVVTTIVILLTHLALKRYQTQVEMMATTDALTGLPNRRAFDIVVEVLFNESTRKKTQIAILLLDIDHFKLVNDRYGHLGGDHVLSEVAMTIKSCMRASDFICRWGGEEFLIVVKDSDAHGVMLLAEKIRIGIESKAISYKGALIHITASLGASMAEQDEVESYSAKSFDAETYDKVQQVIERADAAMYQAKQVGRNQSILSASNRNK
ncbi:MAG TPA: sensor domain-containing diguanylate cyclase [Methylophilaceae bacterium]|nr:sensor domain-containing diguanylate cyclase [Methylophilaceae bacterium]